MKPTLIPLQVPWMVSPSTPFLRLVCSESSSQGDAYVEFVTFNRGFSEKLNSPPSRSSIQVVQPPGAFQPTNAILQTPCRLARMVLKRCLAARMYPSYSDEEVIEESAYDWSQVPGSWKPGEDIATFLERHRVFWDTTGVCPNPNLYEIASSPWLIAMNKHNNPAWKHLLVLGHDAYVEAIAQAYEILLGQAVFHGA